MSLALAEGRYRLIEPIGKGGMGVVWRAEDTRLEVERAVKLLSPSLATEHTYRARFLREARMMAQLRHPNIMPVHDVGDDGEQSFFVMPLIETQNVSERLKAHGAFSIRHALSLIIPIAEALHFAHQSGIIHRDVKPHNLLLLTDDNPVLCDFGIAGAHQLSELTQGGGPLLGTVAYMAPEQLLGERATPSSDLYSLALTLLQMMSNVRSTLLRSREVREGLLRQLPADLAEVLAGPLSDSAHNRPYTGRQFADALRRCLKTAEASHNTSNHTLRLDESTISLNPATPAPAPVRRAQTAPTGTVTLLFGTLGEDSHEQWEAWAPQLYDIATHSRGYVVKSSAKTWMVGFANATDAVQCGLRIVGKILPEGLPLRLGVHTGVPTRVTMPGTNKPDYLGRSVNRAARLMQAAQPGQLVVSETTRSLVGDSVPDGVWTALGDYSLRGVKHPMTLFQVVPQAHVDHDYGPLNTQRIRNTNLSSRGSTFFGREAEMAAIRTHLKEGVRWLTLLGPGGTGKTRLAQEVGRTLLGAYSGGVWFVDLVDSRTQDDILSATAAVFDVPLTDKDPFQQLAWVLENKGPALLVLDNAEQVAERAKACIDAWLRQAPKLAVLVTSQVVLTGQAEQVVSIPPLSTQDVDSAGVALFVSRVQQVLPSFALTTDNADACVGIVQLVAGLPLGIELAAARSRLFTPQTLFERLQAHMGLLTSKQGRRPSRHQTLSATVQWSWDLLDPDEQATLAQCSVFRGGWTLEAAEDIIEVPGDVWVLDILERLVDRSLVVQRDSEVGEVRFTLLPHVHAFAAAQLSPSDNAARRHAMYFAQTYGTKEAIERLHYPQGRTQYRMMRNELENLESALANALAQDWQEPLLGCGRASCEVYHREGPIERELSISKQVQNQFASPSGHPAYWTGRAHFQLGQFDVALQHYEDALSFFERDRDPGMQGWCLIELAKTNHKSLKRAQARDCLKDALTLFTEAKVARGKAESTYLTGVFLHQKAQHAEAVQYLETATELFDDLGVFDGLARSCQAMALALAMLENGALVSDFQKRALDMSRKSHSKRTLASCLSYEAYMSAAQGRFTEALRFAKEAMHVADELGSPVTQAGAIQTLAKVYFQMGRYREAFPLYDDAVAFFGRIGFVIQETIGRLNQSIAYIQFGEETRAARALTEAELLVEQIDHPSFRALCVGLRAEVALMSGQMDNATTTANRSLEMARTAGFKVAMTQSLWVQALIAIRTHQTEHAKHLLQEVVETNGEPTIVRKAYGHLGWLAAEKGAAEEAWALWEQGRAEMETPDLMLLCLEAQIATLTGDTARATVACETAEARFRASGATAISADGVALARAKKLL